MQRLYNAHQTGYPAEGVHRCGKSIASDKMLPQPSGNAIASNETLPGSAATKSRVKKSSCNLQQQKRE
jgi:hypothetical protein